MRAILFDVLPLELPLPTGAKAKSMTPKQHGELMSVIGMAMQTNGLVTAMQVPVDEVFLV